MSERTIQTRHPQLDLEARKIVERTADKPQRYRLR